MKQAFVLDCSVTMSWCFGEGGNYAAGVMASLRTGRAAVPSIWPLEVANALLTSERKRRVAPGDSILFLDLLLGLPIEVEREAASTESWGRIMTLGRAHGLTSYDAAYLDLALRLEWPLATLDARLKRAARLAGVELLDVS